VTNSSNSSSSSSSSFGASTQRGSGPPYSWDFDTPQTGELVWTSDQSWQHTTLITDVHSPGGIRTRNPSKRSAADTRLRVKTHIQRPAACDLIRGNKSTALFPRIKSQAAGRSAPPRPSPQYVCFYP
jgi:hypothetical protein